MQSFRCVPDDAADFTFETTLQGKMLLGMPQLNKGTAFTEGERRMLALEGLLPDTVESLDEQLVRHYEQYQAFESDLARNIYLHVLYSNNETLFYALLAKHLHEMLPVVYTPTVGAAVEKYSTQFRRERGLYLCYNDRDRMRGILEAQLQDRCIRACVVTDGTAVLGIGDQGVGGMAIAIGKQIVYALCGGVNPMQILPIQLDCGTDNEVLLNDPYYLGWRHKRIRGQAFDDFVEQFVATISELVPGIFIHWEDVEREQAVTILDRYQDRFPTFNDDIQGTGAVTMACLLAAIARTGSSLIEQRIVIHGAGAAALGVADHIANAMQQAGLSEAESHARFYLLNRRGLLTTKMEGLSAHQMRFAKDMDAMDSLEAVVAKVKPTVLIGCSTQTNAFTQSIVETMSQHVERPIILPLSNPISKTEILPGDAIAWSHGKALVATGSPFDDVVYEGKTYVVSQCNNAFIYPAIGMGVLCARASCVSFTMLQAASVALSQCVASDANPSALLPALSQYPETSFQVALAVAKQAVKEGRSSLDEAQVEANLKQMFWRPGYRPIQFVS